MISDITSSHASTPHVMGRAAVDAEPPVTPERTPPATYSPVLMWFEQQAKVLVTQFRNPETGELRVQYPAPSVVQRYSESNALGKDEPSPAEPEKDEKVEADSATPEAVPGKAEDTPAPTTGKAAATNPAELTTAMTETATAAATPKGATKLNVSA